MLISILFAVATIGACAEATVINVDVGKNGLDFEPATVAAALGDIINFHFYPINHSVVQSSFDNPCHPLSGGVGQVAIFSGFFPVETGEASKMFSMPVNTTDPIWLYCSQTYDNHCKGGQVMVVNPIQGSSQTFAAYLAASMLVNTTSSPADIFGGVVVANQETSATAASNTTTTSSTSPTLPTGTAMTSTPAKNEAMNGYLAYRSVVGVVIFFTLVAWWTL